MMAVKGNAPMLACAASTFAFLIAQPTFKMIDRTARVSLHFV